MKQTRRPEDEEQLNKTPETPAAADAPQEEPAYSLEEIMNEFGGWTKRDAPAPAEPVTDETVRLAVPAAEAKGEEKPAGPPAGGDTIRFTPVEEEKAPEPERPAVWTYRGEPDPERPAPDPKEARELPGARRGQALWPPWGPGPDAPGRARRGRSRRRGAPARALFLPRPG